MSLTDVDHTLTRRLESRTRGPAFPTMFGFDLTSAVRTDACVLLTGRDVAVRGVAYRIHRLSDWREGPFTIVDCGAPSEIVERMLFEAFSDSASARSHARKRRAGTVLLQDVGQLDRAAQRRLADQLAQLRAMPPLTGPRVMAATADSLLPRVIDGTFDDQLFYRLNVIHFVIPGERTKESARPVRNLSRPILLPRGYAQDGGRSVPRLRLRG